MFVIDRNRTKSLSCLLIPQIRKRRTKLSIHNQTQLQRPSICQILNKAVQNKRKEKNTNSVSTSEHKNCPFQNYAKDLESCKSAISSLQQENRELQEKLKQLMEYAKLTKKEKLLSTAESNQDETKTLKLKLETTVTTAKKYETEVNSLKAKLSDETSRFLILEEENKKLKLSIDCVTKEKTTPQGQMINTTGLSDTTETNIANEMQDIKDEMQASRTQFLQQ